jgi:dienelactone hydrolase
VLTACQTTRLKGDIAGESFPIYTYKPETPGKHPGLLILHTKGGLQAHEHDYASQIAKHGYVAVVVDYMSGSGNSLGNSYRIYDAYQYLKTLPEVDPERIGAVGFSLGPRYALSIASDTNGPILSTGEQVNPKIKAVVSYYVGYLRLGVGEVGGNLEAILFLHGDKDIETPAEDVERFCKKAIVSNIACEFEIYKNTYHAFTHASSYRGYDSNVSKKAFIRSVRFLDKYLK